MKEKDFEVPEMLDGDMIVHIDETIPLEVRDDLVSVHSPCHVCGVPLGLYFVWIVPEGPIHDFFVHENCFAAFKTGQYFGQS
jgi:hypothetical protein